jgi:hypothetical protein
MRREKFVNSLEEKVSFAGQGLSTFFNDTSFERLVKNK